MNENSSLIYLDNAASTPPCPELVEQWPALMTSNFANHGSPHALAAAAREALIRVDGELLAAMDIPPGEAQIVWTSGATEANNLAVLGTLGTKQDPSRWVVVTSAAEHSSVHAACDWLENEGTRICRLGIDANGALDLDAMADVLDDSCCLVSLCHVQNETGAVQDLCAVRELLDRLAPLAVLHVDAVQGLGKMPIPWQAARIDTLSVSGHKIHGPASIGALVLRQEVALKPLMAGGGQQGGLRPGSLDVCAIQGFVIAARRLLGGREAFSAQATALNMLARSRLKALNDRSRGRPKVRFNSTGDGSPYILNVSLAPFQGAVLARMLSERGICVGTGSACASETRQPSPVLTAMGRSRQESFGALRISFGTQNQAADVERFCDELERVLDDY